MATTPTIIWTALPNGYGSGPFPQLSIYVSPRLDDPSGTTLASPLVHVLAKPRDRP